LADKNQETTQLLEQNRRLTQLLATFNASYRTPTLSPDQQTTLGDAEKTSAEATKSLAQLVKAASESITNLETRLFEVSSSVRTEYAEYIGKSDSDVAKLLPEGKYERSVSVFNGGSWYSFIKNGHDYANEASIQLHQVDNQSESLETAFQGLNYGFFLSFGDYPFKDLIALTETSYSKIDAEALKYLFRYIPPTTIKRWRLDQTKSRLGIAIGGVLLKNSLLVAPRTSFLLRVFNDRYADTLIAMRIETVCDDGSIEFVWKRLKSYTIPVPIGADAWGVDIGEMLSEDMKLNHDSDKIRDATISSVEWQLLEQFNVSSGEQVSSTSYYERSGLNITRLQDLGLVAIWPPTDSPKAPNGNSNCVIFLTELGKKVILARGKQ
jgi:hypothetical protein